MEREQDILKELKKLNSPLAVFPRTMPYIVPDAYFDNLPTLVARYVLADTPLTKDMPLAVPDGYFDALPQQLLQAVKNDEAPAKEESKNRSVWLNARWAAAAMLIIFIGLGSYRILTPETLTIQQQLEEIPEAAILAYVQDNIDEFDTEYIVNNLDNANTIQTQAENLNDETIEYYLENSGWQ